jgi:ribose transport system substrate-binding protein
VELLVRDNNMDRQAALDNADWFVANQVDLVIEYQIDARAGNVIMDKFNQARIPVIAVDIPLPGATFYGADNYRAGYIAGEALGHWLRKNWQGHPDILLKLKSDRVGSVSEARLQGQQEGLEAIIGPLAEEKIVAVDSPVIVGELEPVMAQLLQTLSRQARIAIIAINDDAALGALAAFEKAGRLDQVVAVGQNADRLGREALRRPKFPFIGSTQYAPENYGEKLLHLALSLLEGKPVPPAVYNQHVFITPDNINDYYPELVDTIAARR